MTSTRFALCLEQTLGNAAYGRVLEAAAADVGVPHDVHRIVYPEGSRLPIPWALRGSVAAHRRMRSGSEYAAAFYHTQTIALMAPRSVRSGRYVVSVDATPVQMDEMAEWYGHRRWSAPLEALKRRWHRRTFAGAASLVAWSAWAARSLEHDYGVAADRIRVVHPGAPAPFFGIDRRSGARRKPTILFVGAAFERKGGFDLLRAFRRLSDRADLLLVTEDVVPNGPGVRVLRGARPGSPELLRAFAEADVFCLPTYADTLVLAIGEAMAAGLPVVSTNVGAISEWVSEGETGLLCDPGDEEGLFEALLALVDDPALRETMGAAGRERSRSHMDAARNARGIVELLTEVSR